MTKYYRLFFNHLFCEFQMNEYQRSAAKTDSIDQFVTKRVFPRVNNETALEFQVELILDDNV